jgi:hypothetical protein
MGQTREAGLGVETGALRNGAGNCRTKTAITKARKRESTKKTQRKQRVNPTPFA